jgi:2-polyprenyl-3-methyl-5-hydroxy-6-metoxy-1,4-benzoquinol methylase
MTVVDLAVRRIDPELLDALPPSDPRAIGSRRDLVRINAIMFQASIMAGLLRRNVGGPPRRILEIGAGDGSFMLAVARRLAKRWPGVKLTLLDRAALPVEERREAFGKLGWQVEVVTADVFDWLEGAEATRFDVVTTNLFLHHFADPDLARLFARLQALAPVVLATEPHRNAFALSAARLLWAIGANDVTRHDAVASVGAGFRGKELSALWPAPGRVRLTERRVGPFTHTFAASVEAA